MRFWIQNYESVADQVGADTAGSDHGLIRLGIAWDLTNRTRDDFLAATRARLANVAASLLTSEDAIAGLPEGEQGRNGYSSATFQVLHPSPRPLPAPPIPLGPVGQAIYEEGSEE
ncbi:hypothetical protein GCM10027167_44270 [Nocardia heshunensis]